MNCTEALFTAAELARALGCAKQNVHNRLSAVPADGDKVVSGNLAKAWKLASLPPGLISKLGAIAARKNYRNVSQLILNPFVRYEICDASGRVLSVAEIAPNARERAFRLRSALLPLLPLR